MNKYTVIPTDLLLNTELSNSAKLLYISINTLSSDLHFIQLSEKQLSQIMDMADRTVRRNLDELEDNGLIAKYRESVKDINKIIVIPYEMRCKVDITSEGAFDTFLGEVTHFIDTVITKDIKESIKGKKVKKVSTSKDKEEGKVLNARYYCMYFSDRALQEKGIVVNYSSAKALSIMKRVIKGRDEKDIKHLINVFLSMYDRKFKKVGYECPTIEGFGTSWIFNIVVETAKNTPLSEELRQSEKILDIVF